ncbi:hypothetical protein HALLA_12275 [Halostagnicola larsenii XH-48]|uniref:Uncharacterized protein n=1 Tax=Halostagnicola larsenii XH-48 TaxID=797299 RepID=W0JUJ2_9EURY|nr:hypothetical protein [Halostagnicola larsenii]AHG00945.1 hypothetical protein HALLA_11960 [Halostagnicola larsenii XH-48]AHG00997.1 hypothetical protein HALLA_12275 [Halostagnicola larsenii XH-48]
MTFIDVDDTTLLAAHEKLDTDSLEETVELALGLTADLNNAAEMVEYTDEAEKQEVPA